MAFTDEHYFLDFANVKLTLGNKQTTPQLHDLIVTNTNHLTTL